MKKYIYCLLLPFVSLLAVSCSDDDDKLPAVKPADHGTVVDNLGNTYGWVRIGDLLWTTSNANNGPDVWECTYFNRFSWVNVLTNDYGRIPQSSKDAMNTYRLTYGNLMNYATAVASAPEGWRLPSDEDWQKLEKALGMSPAGGFIFEPVYGVIRLNLQYQDVYGFYWTSTVDPSYIDEETAYYRKFLVGNGSIWRECSSTQQLMSVRWVKDAE